MVTKILLLFLLVSGCSTIQGTKEEPRYHPKTKKRQAQLRKIFRMRRARKIVAARKRQLMKSKAAKGQSLFNKPIPRQTSQINAIGTEIDQNLAYFCMKNRKKGAYKNQEKCQQFTRHVYNQCKVLNDNKLNQKLLGCIKSKLR